MRFLKSIVYIIVGLILCLPFIIDVGIMGHIYVQQTLFSLISFMCLMLGCPTFFYGIGKFFIKGQGNSNSIAELDIGRIRYTIEKDSRKK